MWSLKEFLTFFVIAYVLFLLFVESDAMTRQQLKNSGKLMKKTCMPKNNVTEETRDMKPFRIWTELKEWYTVFFPFSEEIGDIEKGKFIEDRRVMCYVACIYSMTQVVKNNKLSYEAIIKQVDMMFPPEMRTAVKAAAENCKDIGKKYKDDVCEASYRTAKCMYDYDAENFVFP